ncbi:prx-12, partial [Symbiodinium microadriaticum]
VLQLLLIHLNEIASSGDDGYYTSSDSEGEQVVPTMSGSTISFTSLCQRIRRTYTQQSERVRSFCVYQKRGLTALTTALKAVQWMQRALYLFDASPFHDPAMALVGVFLRRNNDQRSAGLPASASSDATTAGRSRGPGRVGILAVLMGAVMLVRTIDVVRRAVGSGEAMGGLLGGSDGTDVSSLTPPAPPSLPVGKGCLVPPTDPSLCPLCRQPRVNPCASTGGYVFCYSCLSASLVQQQTCPVTGIPCDPLAVIRLFEQELIP